MSVRAFFVIVPYPFCVNFSVHSKELECKMEELAQCLEQLQAMVSEVEDERDGYATIVTWSINECVHDNYTVPMVCVGVVYSFVHLSE